MTENAKRVVALGLDLVERGLAEARAELAGAEPAAARPADKTGGVVKYLDRPVEGHLIEGPSDEQVRLPAKAVGRVGTLVLVEVNGRPGQVAVRGDRFRVAKGAAGESEFAGPDGAPLSVNDFVKPDCTTCGSFPCSCITKGSG